jgi:hypothetical protein
MRQQERSVVRLALPIVVLAVGATLALRCGSGRESDRTEVRHDALTIATQTATSWWRIWDTGGTNPFNPVAAIPTASRGTEVFQFLTQNDFLAQRTRSNIELNSGGSGAVATKSLDNASVAVTSADGGTTIDAFWRYADQTLGMANWNGTAFVTPANVPPFGQFLSGVGAAGQTNREDVFGVGLDSNLYQAWRGTAAWNGWFNIGSPPSGSLAALQPAAVYLPGNMLYVFAVGSDGAVWSRLNPNNPTWNPWASVSGSVASGIAVAFSGTSRIDVFAVHTGGTAVDWRTFDAGAGTWSAWTSIPTPPAGAKMIDATHYATPTAIARAEGAVDLFVRDAGNAIQLMTIRPTPTLSGLKERTVAILPSSCGDLTAGMGENPAATTACNDGKSYEFLSHGDWGVLRTEEGACFLNLPAPSSPCPIPSGAMIPECTPFEIRFPGNERYGMSLPGFDVAEPSGLRMASGNLSLSNDNQVVRLSNNDLVSLRHYGICSPSACVPTGPTPVCNPNNTKTGGDLFFRTTPANCGASWSYQGRIDPCQKFPSNCYNGTDCDHGTGTDRPEMAARGTDLFVTEMITWANPAPGSHVVWKSTDEGTTWTEWVANTANRVVSQAPVEITTVGSHLTLLGRQSTHTPAIWSQSKDTKIDPAPTALSTFTDLDTVDYGDAPSIIHSSLGIAQASSSPDGDYLRIVYPTKLSGGAQAARTGLVRVNSNQSITTLTDSFGTGPQIVAQVTGGSVLYPTLVEADRVSGPTNGDERPPVVLFWVETTKTPPSTDPTCVHGPPVTGKCDWGTVSIRATVFRGAAQSQPLTITTTNSLYWRGNGDYVHGSSRYASPADRFFLHWYNENGTAQRKAMGRLLDVAR